MGELQFRKDLYAGTAEYYDRFRPPYPPALLGDLRARVPLHGASRVLDLACGTGQIAFALSPYVGEIVAVDQEREFVEFGARKATERGVANIVWREAAAEAVTFDDPVDLVAIGNAFHRLDRDAVAARLVPQLRPNGCVALCWGDGPSAGDLPWQRELREALDEWTERCRASDRVPANWAGAIDEDPHAQVLQRAGLEFEGRFEFATIEHWTVDSLIGFTYSTSVLSRPALGADAEAFEADLRARLPGDAFEQRATYAYELARLPR